MNTQQQGIVDFVAAALATIAGIVTVTKNRAYEEPFGLEQLPAINFSASQSDIIQEHSAGTDERLTTAISVFCAGSTAPNDSLNYLALALGKIGADETLGGKAIDSRKGKRITANKHGDVVLAEAHQEIQIDYRSPRWGF